MEKYKIEDVKELNKVPESQLKTVYDTDDNVLFGSRMTKGKVQYKYIPAELMETGNPYIVNVGISYDGKGNSDLPKDALIMPFEDLPKMFPDNVFK